MLISPTHRFIFFHVGKTGGMSVREVLRAYAEEPEFYKIRRPLRTHDGKPNPLYAVWETLLLHARARDARRELPGNVFSEYYKFAFVRNPWDWHVSMYHFLLSKPMLPQHAILTELGSFDGYIQWACRTPAPYPRGISKLQSEIPADSDGKLLVDFLGRFETLAAYFQRVAATVGISGELPHLNGTQHQDYRMYYSAHTRRLIEQHFAPDIELGKYSFDRDSR